MSGQARLSVRQSPSARAIFVSVELSLRGAPRGRENRGGLPADADAFLVVGGRDSVWRRGPTAGSRTVALSTPVRVPVPTGLPGSPDPIPRMVGGRLWLTARPSRSKNPRSSWRGSLRSTWPRRRGWCARGCRTRPSRASAPPRCGRCRPPPTPSSSWPSSWPAKGSTGSWPGSTSDYWRAWLYLLQARGLVVWLVNARDARAPAGPAQDRQAGCGVAGQAQRAGHAAPVVCPTGRDPPVAGLHPAAVRPDRRARPAGAAAGAGC
jgi:hypothetical protein